MNIGRKPAIFKSFAEKYAAIAARAALKKLTNEVILYGVNAHAVR